MYTIGMNILCKKQVASRERFGMQMPDWFINDLSPEEKRSFIDQIKKKVDSGINFRELSYEELLELCPIKSPEHYNDLIRKILATEGEGSCDTEGFMGAEYKYDATERTILDVLPDGTSAEIKGVKLNLDDKRLSLWIDVQKLPVTLYGTNFVEIILNKEHAVLDYVFDNGKYVLCGIGALAMCLRFVDRNEELNIDVQDQKDELTVSWSEFRGDDDYYEIVRITCGSSGFNYYGNVVYGLEIVDGDDLVFRTLQSPGDTFGE